MGEPEERPFVGSEARAAEILSRHELRTYYTAIMPNVYLDRRATLTLRHRTEAAWLWSQREAVVSGLAASALHGASWVDDDATVELIWRNARAPHGVKTRADLLLDGESQRLGGVVVTDVERVEYIRQVGWTHIKVLAEHPGYDVIRRVRSAWDALKRR